jgi:hypothetical protein
MKEFLMFAFIITASIEGHGADERAALRNAARAFYKQSGTEADVNAFVKKEVPKELQTIAGNAFLIAKTIQDKRLTVTWSF